MNLLEVLIRGGWIILPILLSSVVVIALGISRYLALKQEKKELARFVTKWKSALPGTDPVNYKASCKMGPSFTNSVSSILEEGVASQADLLSRIETAARQELYRLENGLGTIATLAAATPLLGFLGTVTGMIRAFMQIQKLGGNVNANVLAGGIWEALVTTATGLAVGIVALVIHNYLAGIVKQNTQLIEQAGDITMRIMGASHEA